MIKFGSLVRWIVLVTLPVLCLTGPASAAKLGAGNIHLLGWAERSSLSSLGSVGSCPKPSLNLNGDPPTSVTGPFLLVPGSDQHLGSSANAGPVGVSCKWKLNFIVHKHDPTVWVTTLPGIPLQPGVINEFNSNGTDGVHCAAYYQIDNGFGGAAAQAALASTQCNTDGFTNGEGSVAVINGNLKTGPTTIVAPTQSHWYVSYVGGSSVLVGQFTFCSQDPVGQHSTYACIQFDAGPYE